MRGELRCPACKHDWATAARADSANHGNHAGHSSYSRRGVLPLLALSARAVDHIRVTILRAAFTAALALGAYTTPLAAHAAAPTRALPGPLSAGRSAIPVGCGCAGSAARRSAPLSVARAPPRGAPARRAVRGISFVALHGGERVQIGFVFERHPAHVISPRLRGWATLWARACPQCHWRASHGALCPSPSRAARLPSSTSSSAATKGFSPSAQTRDRPG